MNAAMVLIGRRGGYRGREEGEGGKVEGEGKTNLRRSRKDYFIYLLSRDRISRAYICGFRRISASLSLLCW